VSAESWQQLESVLRIKDAIDASEQRTVWIRAVFAALYDGCERISPGIFETQAGMTVQRHISAAELVMLNETAVRES
jgi:hypothetical protein